MIFFFVPKDDSSYDDYMERDDDYDDGFKRNFLSIFFEKDLAR